MEKLVSIIIAVYNGEQYISQTLESIACQTYHPVEVVVVDDGSQDNTLQIVESFRARLDHLVVLHQSNQGSAAARNLGFAHARGTYFAIIDADDTMFPERIEKQVKFLDVNPAVAVVSCLANYINEKGQIIGKTYTDLHTIEDCQEYLRDDKIIFCLQPGVMLRPEAVEAVGGYRKMLRYAQDTDLWNRMVEKGYFLVVMPEILVNYRIHRDASMTKFKERIDYDDWVIYNTLRRRRQMEEVSFDDFVISLSQKSVFSKAMRMKKHYGKRFYRTAGLMFGNKRYTKFVGYLMLAFVIWPAYTVGKLSRQKLSVSNVK